jgi:hypothetical protein
MGPFGDQQGEAGGQSPCARLVSTPSHQLLAQHTLGTARTVNQLELRRIRISVLLECDPLNIETTNGPLNSFLTTFCAPSGCHTHFGRAF